MFSSGSLLKQQWAGLLVCPVRGRRGARTCSDCLWNLGTGGIDEESQEDAWELTLPGAPKRR